MKVRLNRGKCTGCGRPGVTTVRVRDMHRKLFDEFWKRLKSEEHMLTHFGASYFCCSTACYKRAIA